MAIRGNTKHTTISRQTNRRCLCKQFLSSFQPNTAPSRYFCPHLNFMLPCQIFIAIPETLSLVAHESGSLYMLVLSGIEIYMPAASTHWWLRSALSVLSPPLSDQVCRAANCRGGLSASCLVASCLTDWLFRHLHRNLSSVLRRLGLWMLQVQDQRSL